MNRKKAKAARKNIGHDFTGSARSIEGTMAFLGDRRLINTDILTAKERKAMKRAEELIGEGTRYLRILGNHLANPKEEA